MEVKIVSKKLIKPIVATPDSLRKYKISCMDEVNATMNVVTILYYPFNQFYTYKGIIKTLETSLSRILPRFYPFAGRYIKEHHTVDCNDAGAEFMEAEVDAYDLKQVITNLEPDYLNELLPLEIGAADEITDPVCAVKVTKFRCGGIALAASVSHRIVDACSMGIFVSAWAEEATLREGQSRTIHPFHPPRTFLARIFLLKILESGGPEKVRRLCARGSYLTPRPSLPLGRGLATFPACNQG
ncbi:pelargonidin 3-O-(6-caffeoylglucoside) 5-O-(6-O-malonylglucoside) 4'''-malonyltransferase [Beta vulgaris subsp. vulgaris]|uniref:pelargonidin 3-O-(6-caffeoylglucoside) 5-O-(6-O-malonylglucoside) 4'''-malonyltransferase n=1 Tax=Beta vulgaris subsp. vulgaris TaxID=3555 RepID=UPI0025485684|nr:pelargonidin 3-O-(6-caffeoylglucoside) 5-O-(6-O-malonylglucoside) 4'''-malonyltransferase [Beta vulgaris subsp. vulgaris]XP_010692558.2 pelargonidin 3-O-(6-caffeoylglucoside) 5-O-(6-O-malonylglucoside) 4'''-malonyltransferase [Beta vulgaris subsp. vulgaris]